MRAYRLVTPANKDLAAILEYLHSHNPSAAERFLTSLHQRLTLLASQPKSGHRRPEFGREELLYISFQSYVIAYLPNTRPLTIVAILHGSRDLASLLETLK